MNKQSLFIHNKYQHLFFSPHIDDVILSCGGLISNLSNKESVLIITVFTKATDEKISNLGKEFIKLCGFNSAKSLFDSRKEEEERVAKFLKYDYLFLDYADAAFRFHSYFIFKKLLYPKGCFSKVSSNDSILIKDIKVHIHNILKKISNKKCSVYFPLGIGEHADHQILKQIGLSTKSKNIFYYEDFPYCINQNDKQYFVDTLRPKTIYLTKATLQKKYKAILLYKSQIKPVFKSEGNFEKQFWNYYKQPYENYWYFV